jgi:ABC-2 type transport system permease protein
MTTSSSNVLPGHLRMLGSQLRYQVTLIMRNPRAFIFGLIMPGLLLALQLHHKHASTAALAAGVAGLMMFGMLNIAYLTYAAGLAVAREDGVLRRWRATPLPVWTYFAGRIIAAVVLADVAGLLLVVVGASWAGLHLTVAGAGFLLLATTAGAITLGAVGTAITPLLPPGQGAYSMLAISYLPLLIFSGGFGSINNLPSWLTRTMTYLPVQPVIDASSKAIQYGSVAPTRDLLVLAAWTVGCLALSIRFFRWEPTRPAHAKRPTVSTPAISTPATSTPVTSTPVTSTTVRSA